VCGAKVLDEQWAEDARIEINQLTSTASDAYATEGRLTAAIRAVRELLGPVPSVLAQDFGTEIDTAAVVTAWRAWAELVDEAS
jgi:hypothetical protein